MSSQPGRSRRKARPPAPSSSRNSKPAADRRAPADPPASDRPASDRPASDRPGSTGFTVTPGIVVLSIGAFLILLAFSVLAWFRDGPGFFSGASDNSRFGDLHKLIAHYKQQSVSIRGHVSFGVAEFYFGWLGWLFFLAAVGLGALAVSRVGASHWYLRWLACVVAVSGAAFTIASLKLVTFEGKARVPGVDAPTYTDYLHNSGFGLWAAVLGFVLIAIAVFLPRRDA